MLERRLGLAEMFTILNLTSLSTCISFLPKFQLLYFNRLKLYLVQIDIPIQNSIDWNINLFKILSNKAAIFRTIQYEVTMSKGFIIWPYSNINLLNQHIIIANWKANIANYEMNTLKNLTNLFNVVKGLGYRLSSVRFVYLIHSIWDFSRIMPVLIKYEIYNQKEKEGDEEINHNDH